MLKLNSFKAFRNQPYQIPVFLVDEAGRDLPSNGLTAISLLIRKQDDTLLEKAAVTGLTWGYGEKTSMYLFNFTDVETILFKLGLNQTAFLKISFADTVLKFSLKEFLSVYEELF